jgi:hypothetical protein
MQRSIGGLSRQEMIVKDKVASIGVDITSSALIIAPLLTEAKVE